jgi:hypothetical protein
MSDKQYESESLPSDLAAADLEARKRREFLLSLGKWSKVVIGGVLLGGVLVPDQNAKAWGGGPGGGAGLWYNSGAGWGGWVQQAVGLAGWTALAWPTLLARPTLLAPPRLVRPPVVQPAVVQPAVVQRRLV